MTCTPKTDIQIQCTVELISTPCSYCDVPGLLGHHACLWLALPDPTMNVLTYHYVLLHGHNQRSTRFNKMLMKIIYRIVWGLSCKYRPTSDIKYHNYLSDNCSVRSAGLAMLIVDVGLRALDQGRSKLPYHSFGMVTSK